MAKAKKDVRTIIEDRLIDIDSGLDEMKKGSEDYSRCVKDISMLARSVAELKKEEIQDEDNKAKRDEQKRMNDKELEFKEAQLVIDHQRMENEKANRSQQLKQDLLKIGLDSLTSGFAYVGYFGMTRRVMKHEYQISDGASLLPPSGVGRALDNIKPKKKF